MKLQDEAGKVVEIEGELAEQMAKTIVLFFHALQFTDEMLRFFVQGHVEHEHDGNWDAQCGFLEQMKINAKLLRSRDAVVEKMPEGMTCH